MTFLFLCKFPVFCLLLAGNIFLTTVDAFTALPACCCSKTSRHQNNHRSLLLRESPTEDTSKEGPFDFIFNPIKSTIPKEVEQEIYQAEANTQAAKERGKRVAIYAVICLIGVTGAFYNGFLTELRASSAPDEIPFVIEESAFAWVLSSWLTKFLFMNKIGGALLLLFGAGSGLLAEAEMDTRRTNAEKIWEEMQRRRSAAEGKKQKNVNASKKKQKAGKKSKRLDALVEVIDEESVEKEEETLMSSEPNAAPPVDEKGAKSEGILGAVKDFYKKADNMAASQALLLNKELEDRGVVEKITDETGLKVIGKEEAKKLREKKKQ
ncbi:hypothetical protein MPSEU_000666000 [Mayamaea pseudoterrestris]|nr:hypothetical protein MPSEU_000666000 [Mayamaea pseudoterrestris]